MLICIGRLLTAYLLVLCLLVLFPFKTLTFDEPVNDNASSTERLSVVVLNADATSQKFVTLIHPCYVCDFSTDFTSSCHVMFHRHISDVVPGSESESEFSGLSAAQTK